MISGLPVVSDKVVGPAKPELHPFDVSQRASLAVPTFDSLGLVTDRPALSDAITNRMLKLHNPLVADAPADHTIEVEPFMTLELTDAFTFKLLITAFDKKQTLPTI